MICLDCDHYLEADELTVEYITGEEWEQRLMKGRNDPNCI